MGYITDLKKDLRVSFSHVNSSPEAPEHPHQHQTPPPPRGEDCRTHLVAHFVQIGLELLLDVSGQVGAAGANLLHLLPLTLAGEVKGQLMGTQVVELVPEILRHGFDPVQRMRKVLLALPEHKKKKRRHRLSDLTEDGRMDGLEVPGVGSELLLQHDVVPAEGDGLPVVLVPVPDGDVPLLFHVEDRVAEVGLNEADHGFLLGVEALQGLHLVCKQDS